MDEARARDVLAAAGLAAGEARLLALGENAVFAAGDLVVKVGRDAELLARARRELDVAEWLAWLPVSPRCGRPRRSPCWWRVIR